jgi:hypothetical protein
MVARQAVEARYGSLHNIGMAIGSIAMVSVAAYLVITQPDAAARIDFSDPKFVLFGILGAAMVFYAGLGLTRYLNRAPQIVIDRDGIFLGFGRNRLLPWSEIDWVRLHRIAVRPQLRIGLTAEAFVKAELRLTTWHLDDALRPVRGMPAAVTVRDNGLDTRAAELFQAVKAFRPNLVKS